MPNDIFYGGIRVGGALTANTTVNFTSGMTAAVMQALINAQPKNLNGYTLTFQFADGTYNTTMTAALTFYNFYGGGAIYILGNTGETDATALHTTQSVYLDFSSGTSTGIDIMRCQCDVFVQNLKIKISDTANVCCLSIIDVDRSLVYYCYFLGAAKTTSCFGCQFQATFANVLNTYVDNVANGISSSRAVVSSNNNDSTGTDCTYGLYAINGGVIGKAGTNQPSGSTLNEYPINGGMIYPNYLTANTTVNIANNLTAAQIQALIDAQPKNLNTYTLTFQVADSSTKQDLTALITIQGFYGGGAVYFQGNVSETDASKLHETQSVYLDFSGGTSSGILVTGNSSPVYIRNLKIKISDTNNAYCVSVTPSNSGIVYVNYNYLLAAGKTQLTVNGVTTRGINVQCWGNYLSNLVTGLQCYTAGNLYSNGNADYITGIAGPTYGLQVLMGGVIIKEGTQPAGTSANENVTPPGRILS